MRYAYPNVLRFIESRATRTDDTGTTELNNSNNLFSVIFSGKSPTHNELDSIELSLSV